jgi:hypothetical protein
MNHRGLFVKLMQRHLPECLLTVLEDWFNKCYTSVKWFSVLSDSFKLEIGIRQGGVLSPQFFAIYIDDIVDTVKKHGVGCHLRHVCVSIILYADDILLLAPSVTALQQLLLLVETELHILDMYLNVSKTVCMRIGPQYQSNCANIHTVDGNELKWVAETRYLGIYIVSSCKFKCSYETAKKSFYRSFNAIYGRIGRTASEEVILSLIKAKCLPVLLYGMDACPINAADSRSLDFTVNRILMKMFRTFNMDIISDCQLYFKFPPTHQLVNNRKNCLLRKFISSINDICLLCCDAAESDLNCVAASAIV